MDAPCPGATVWLAQQLLLLLASLYHPACRPVLDCVTSCLLARVSFTLPFFCCRDKATAGRPAKPPAAAAAAEYELDAPAAAAAAEQPLPKKKRSKGSNPWSSSEGWRAVDVNDEVILGAEEYGFAGLEVLDDISLLDPGGYVDPSLFCCYLFCGFLRCDQVSYRTADRHSPALNTKQWPPRPSECYTVQIPMTLVCAWSTHGVCGCNGAGVGWCVDRGVSL